MSTFASIAIALVLNVLKTNYITCDHIEEVSSISSLQCTLTGKQPESRSVGDANMVHIC